MVAIIQNDSRVPPGLCSAGCQAQIVHAYEYQPFPAVHELDAVVILGGYMSFDDDEQYGYLRAVKKFMAAVLAAEVPLLGICLGGQMLADVLGSSVYHQRSQEKGLSTLQLTAAGCADPLFATLPETLIAFQWHNDSFAVPKGATQLAYSENCSAQAFRYQNACGVQFHPEVTPAIVNSWCRDHGGCADIASAFAAAYDQHSQLYRRLLHNFYLNSESAAAHSSAERVVTHG